MTYQYQRRELDKQRSRKFANIKLFVVCAAVLVVFAAMVGNVIDQKITARCEAAGGSSEECAK